MFSRRMRTRFPIFRQRKEASKHTESSHFLILKCFKTSIEHHLTTLNIPIQMLADVRYYDESVLTGL